jgi:hypothetical protein
MVFDSGCQVLQIEFKLSALTSLYVGGGGTYFPKAISHPKILGTRKVARSCSVLDPQTLGVTVQNSVATATWRPGFAHPCFM